MSWAERVPEPTGRSTGASQFRAFLTVSVGDRRFALAAETVREIIRVPGVTRVPQSPRALHGIVNLRGVVLPVASLRTLLALGAAEFVPNGQAVVLDVGFPVALAVDGVHALQAVAADDIDVTPSGARDDGAHDGAHAEGSTGVIRSGADRGTATIVNVADLLRGTFTARQRIRTVPLGQAPIERMHDDERPHRARQMLVSFTVAGQEFALPLQQVDEVAKIPKARGAVPHSEALVLGVASFRGGLLPLLSLRGLLGLTQRVDAVDEQEVIVTNIGGTKVGLVADEARSVIAADVDAIDPVPAVIAARMGSEARLSGMYRGSAGQRLVGILSLDQLLRADAVRQLRASTGDMPMAEPTQSRSAEVADLSLLVFRLGDDEFALPIEAVEEIAAVPQQVRRVPKTPRFLEGVTNWRGAVLPVIDQRRRFDMPALDAGTGRRMIVVRTDAHRAGLIVDAVTDVLRVSSSTLKPAPDLTGDVNKLILGVVNPGNADRMILLVDSAELLTRAERGLLEKFQKESTQAAS